MSLAIWETRHLPKQNISQHRHKRAYVTFVHSGIYEERSVDGCFACEPGDVVFHPQFHLHGNQFGSSEVVTTNIHTWDDIPSTTYGIFESQLSKEIHDLTRHHLGAVIKGVFDAGQPKTPMSQHNWFQQLSRLLFDPDECNSIMDLAQVFNKSPEHISRSFRKYYGVGPSSYRREARIRRAITLLKTDMPLTQIAMEAGFADQSHLTRTIKLITGHSPAKFRDK